MMKRLVPTLMVAGVASLLISLLLGGFIVYQWVLAFEATAASIALFVYHLRSARTALDKPSWPPLLPLGLIGAAGGAKSFFVASGRDTPLLVVVILLAAIIWFVVASWKIRKAQRSVRA
ncbi:MAG TPA: hypothetical protein VIT88_03820 [Pyrinomonadaceae bacterium]